MEEGGWVQWPPPTRSLPTRAGPSLLTERWFGAWARGGSRATGGLCSCRSPSSCSSSSVFMDSPCLARPAQSGGGELGAGGTGTAAAACCCCSSFRSSSCCRAWQRGTLGGWGRRQPSPKQPLWLGH